MGKRISYWLVPAETDGEVLAEIMCDLAGWIIDAPIFDPHVTLYSGPFGATDNVPAILESATRGLSEITLRSTGLAHSAQFTKTLFVEFAPDEMLSQISTALKEQSSQLGDYELKPHLSLVYANLSTEVREHFARQKSVPPRVRFDRVRAILSQGPTHTREDVDAWRVVAERWLDGS